MRRGKTKGRRRWQRAVPKQKTRSLGVAHGLRIPRVNNHGKIVAGHHVSRVLQALAESKIGLAAKAALREIPQLVHGFLLEKRELGRTEEQHVRTEFTNAVKFAREGMFHRPRHAAVRAVGDFHFGSAEAGEFRQLQGWCAGDQLQFPSLFLHGEQPRETQNEIPETIGTGNRESHAEFSFPASKSSTKSR